MKLIQKALIERNGKYLVTLRSKNAKYFPLYYDFPGGKLEFGEDFIDGIKREVKEETDLDCEVIKVLAEYEFDLDNKGQSTHRFKIYNVKVDSDEVKISSEHEGYLWVTKEELVNLKTEPYVKLLFEDNLI